MKKAFTLAEILIVLAVIGILTAILLPAARHIMPDKNVLKFKKAHNTLYSAIRELVNSDSYYLDGDLGRKPNGDWVVEKDYFLKTLSDVVSTKKSVLPSNEAGVYDYNAIVADTLPSRETIDTVCKDKQNNYTNYVLTSDNVYYSTYDDNLSFGADSPWFLDNIRNPFYYKSYSPLGDSMCIDSATEAEKAECVRQNVGLNGFYFVYRILCMDIDEINEGEDPFGYALRIDGKMFSGNRADEWLNKSINQKD